MPFALLALVSCYFTQDTCSEPIQDFNFAPPAESHACKGVDKWLSGQDVAHTAQSGE